MPMEPVGCRGFIGDYNTGIQWGQGKGRLLDAGKETVLKTSDNRIAIRHVFEARILIRFVRGEQKFSAQGWARDLSESGLAAFVAERLELGEVVTLQLPLGEIGKETIAAKVSRKLGTQYGFQFTALSAKQRRAIQAVLKVQKEIPYHPVKN
jgi:hypothetical protein